MLIFRYLLKETLKSQLAIFFILMAIFAGNVIAHDKKNIFELAKNVGRMFAEMLRSERCKSESCRSFLTSI